MFCEALKSRQGEYMNPGAFLKLTNNKLKHSNATENYQRRSNKCKGLYLNQIKEVEEQ
jgi:hypothetical protein